MRIILFIGLVVTLVSAQGGGEDVAENAENIRRLYGIATKIMELGGNFMGGNGGGGGTSSGGYDEIRPRFQGVRSFSEDNSILSGGSSSSGMNSMARMINNYQGMFSNAKFYQPTTTTTEAPAANFKSLFDKFMGTSQSSSGDIDDMENLPPPPTPKPRPRQNLFNLLGGQTNSNIPTSPALNENASNLINNFFGFNRPTTTTTTTTEAPAPFQRMMNMFVPQPENTDSDNSSRGKINFLEMFGLAAPRTTTTTPQPPLQALFAPSKPYSGTAEDLDGIMNALLRSNARPARQEPASLISQFFGGRK